MESSEYDKIRYEQTKTKENVAQSCLAMFVTDESRKSAALFVQPLC